MVYFDGIHMAADSLGELLMFARALGLAQEWIQCPQNGHSYIHFDITSERISAMAYKRGAIKCTARKILAIANAMSIDEDNEKLLDALFANDGLPVIGKSGQTKIDL